MNAEVAQLGESVIHEKRSFEPMNGFAWMRRQAITPWKVTCLYRFDGVINAEVAQLVEQLIRNQ